MSIIRNGSVLELGTVREHSEERCCVGFCESYERTMLRLRLPLLGSLRSFYLFSCLSISAVVNFYRALFDEFKHNAMQNSCNSINGNVYLFSSRKRLNRLPSLLLLLRKLKGLGARILQSRASTGLTIKFNEQIKR